MLGETVNAGGRKCVAAPRLPTFPSLAATSRASSFSIVPEMKTAWVHIELGAVAGAGAVV